MKNSKKDIGIAGQSATNVKKSQKHDANLQKNSSLYFQIGLILCLLGTYGLFEMQFQEQQITIDTLELAEVSSIYIVPPFVEEIIPPEEVEPIVQRAEELIDIYEKVDNNHQDPETNLITPEEKKVISKPADIGSIFNGEDPKKVDPDNLVPFSRIEKVPVYPGCEKYTTNDERMQCMSDKISKLVGNKFNADLASEYGLSGKQRISTQFTIDKLGNVIDIKIRAPHPALEDEANRVINKIPKMEPGLQRNVPVGVIYTLPIVFEVRD